MICSCAQPEKLRAQEKSLRARASGVSRHAFGVDMVGGGRRRGAA